jgi:hypothetical protein
MKGEGLVGQILAVKNLKEAGQFQREQELLLIKRCC